MPSKPEKGSVVNIRSRQIHADRAVFGILVFQWGEQHFNPVWLLLAEIGPGFAVESLPGLANL